MESSQKTIEDLPDEILMEIICYLSIHDRIRLERVSKKWQCLCLKSCRKVKMIDLDSSFDKKTKDLQLSQIKGILWRCGDYLTHIMMRGSGELVPMRSVFTLINKYCKNLTELNLPFSKFNDNDLNFLSKEIVQKLTWVNFNWIQSEDDPKVLKSFFKKAVNLEHLTMTHYSGLIGLSLLSLSSTLTLLDVSDGLSMSHALLTKVIKHLPNLESLSTSDDCISPASLSTVCNQLKYLRMLGMRRFFEGYLYNNLSFPKLEKLAVLRGTFQEDFLTFLNRECPALQELELYGNSGGHKQKNLKLKRLTSLKLSDAELNTLECLASNSRNLKVMECVTCENITDTGLSSIFVNLRQLESFSIGFTPHAQAVKLVEAACKSVQLRENKTPLRIKVSTNKRLDDVCGSNKNVNVKVKYSGSSAANNSEGNGETREVYYYFDIKIMQLENKSGETVS